MSEGTLLFIHALTSLHPGTGTALGVVDLPVQRERHTGWPTVPGSSLKGVLRDECRQKLAQDQYDGDLSKANEDRGLTVVFGPAKVDEDTSHAGAVAITDARILAFPVRSIKGVFAWVTCPAVLARLERDLAYVDARRAGQGSAATPSFPAWTGKKFEVDEGKALCPPDSPLLVDGKSLVLEEFDFQACDSEEARAVGSWLAHNLGDSAIHDRLRGSLVITTDDDFNHFVTHATEVVARVGLDYERKTVKQGALFYEEFLPPETILYALVTAEAGRQKRNNGHQPMSADEVLQFLREEVPPFVQIGGDETIGKGICAVRFAR